jgi:hypothetical protein
MRQIQEILDKIVGVVLAYKPKPEPPLVKKKKKKKRGVVS